MNIRKFIKNLIENYRKFSKIDKETQRYNARLDKACKIIKNRYKIAITPNKKYIYRVNPDSNTVSVIDISKSRIVATISVGSKPSGIVITPDGKYAYVTNTNSNTVSVIDTSINLVIVTITVGINPLGIVITPDNGKYVYVANFGSKFVSVIDTSVNIETDTIDVVDECFTISITMKGEYICVQKTDFSLIIDTFTKKDLGYKDINKISKDIIFKK